ncbi:hypothetical protein GA0115250_13635 [Streptomyces sp. BvitLS-983]|nr:hypothetical protein GA0115250_13635 [Streptomyces sp. BvitLS-983]
MTINSMFPNSQLYETGYCVIFARGINPAEILARVSGQKVFQFHLNRIEAEAIKALGEDIEEEDVPDLNLEELYESGILNNSGPLLRAGTYNDWSFAIESEGPYLADDRLLRTASQNTEAISARVSETGSKWISYAERGEILSSFDPLFPHHDYGSRPSILEGLTNYQEAISRGNRADSFENAFREIQHALNCAVPKEADALRLLTVRVAGAYS